MVTLDCLKGFIGLSDKVATSPSGLYVVTLPGISMVNIDKIADKSEHEGPQVVFEECEQRAILRFRNAFIAAMSKCWHLNNLDIAECLICEYKERLATSLWWYLGHEVMVERVSSDRLNRFTAIDRQKAKEIRDEMFSTAEYELENLVKGIDPNNSPCIEDEPVRCGNIVSTVIPCI